MTIKIAAYDYILSRKLLEKILYMSNKCNVGACVIRCVNICAYKLYIVNLNPEDQYSTVFALDLLFNFHARFGIKKNCNTFTVFAAMAKVNFIAPFIAPHFL